MPGCLAGYRRSMRVVVMEDYQRAVERLACFSRLAGHEVSVQPARPADVAERAAQIGDAEALVLIRERTAIDGPARPPPQPEADLPDGPRRCRTSTSPPARDAGSSSAPAGLAVRPCGADARPHPRLGTAPRRRRVALRAGTWQTTIGTELHGRTLGHRRLRSDRSARRAVRRRARHGCARLGPGRIARACPRRRP